MANIHSTCIRIVLGGMHRGQEHCCSLDRTHCMKHLHLQLDGIVLELVSAMSRANDLTRKEIFRW